MNDTVIAYHFVGDTLRDGRPIPPDGEWLEHDDECIICVSGLHASRTPAEALPYAPGNTLCMVECADIDDEQSDKFVCRRRRVIARVDATGILQVHARRCALQVIDLWDAPDIVRTYLETGDASIAAEAAGAAEDAAEDAAEAAAWAAEAAEDAAEAADAAEDAAEDAADAAEDAAEAAAWAARAAAEAAAWAARAAAEDAAEAAAWAARAAAEAAAWAARAAAEAAAEAAAWAARAAAEAAAEAAARQHDNLNRAAAVLFASGNKKESKKP